MNEHIKASAKLLFFLAHFVTNTIREKKMVMVAAIFLKKIKISR